jgi:hypothetical protein
MKLMPQRTRAPFPLQALLLAFARLLSRGELALALAIWIGFHGYLRPREISSLRRSQLLPPVSGSGPAAEMWAINLHASELLQASKTGYFDETIVLDDVLSRSALQPFFRLLRGDGGTEPLWPFDHNRLVAEYATTMKELQLTALETSLYALRHGGASTDFLLRRRPLAEIKMRGRWTSDASLRRYQKSAVVQQEVAKMGSAATKASKKIETSLAAILDTPFLAVAILEPLLK